MPTTSRLVDPDSRSDMHRSLQRRVTMIAIGIAIVLAIVLVPLLTNPELRLDVFRSAGWVPSSEGELIAEGESDATLIVVPTVNRLESTDRPEIHFLATYLTWPDEEGMRLEPINGGEPFTLPIDDYNLVSASPDGTELYLRGDENAVLIDVVENRVAEQLPADEAPRVEWDWRQPTWNSGVGRCDLVSPQRTWIGCFERPVLAAYLAGDWHLSIRRYGGSEEKHDIARGLGFRPILGFSADEQWIYLYNERGIRRFSVPAPGDS